MTKEIVKKPTFEESKNLVLNNMGKSHTLDDALEKVSETLFKIKYGNKKESKIARDSFYKTSMDVLRSLETDIHMGLVEAVTDRYKNSVKELAKQIIKDYGCATGIEKALASDIAHSYIKTLDNSRRLNNEFNCENLTKTRNEYIAILSKQTDRAHRQFLSGLMILKQLKAPAIELNIRANTAFVSQNQQINLDKKNQ